MKYLNVFEFLTQDTNSKKMSLRKSTKGFLLALLVVMFIIPGSLGVAVKGKSAKGKPAKAPPKKQSAKAKENINLNKPTLSGIRTSTASDQQQVKIDKQALDA